MTGQTGMFLSSNPVVYALEPLTRWSVERRVFAEDCGDAAAPDIRLDLTSRNVSILPVKRHFRHLIDVFFTGTQTRKHFDDEGVDVKSRWRRVCAQNYL